MALKKGYKQLLDEANAEIETISVEDMLGLQEDPDVLIIDIRDIRERNNGFIPNSKHAPRGMLEFWADPDSPYHKDYFASGKKLVLHCASGWRSALAAKALQDMGIENIAHIGGGITAWEEAGGTIEGKE
ncbi:MAG: rhodanese-like domain-containing protein [Chloroflexota bacterium]